MLIYPDWTEEVPDDVIPHIIEIGKVGIDVQALGNATAIVLEKWDKDDVPSLDYVRKNHIEIPAEFVTADMLFLHFSTARGYRWFVGNSRLEDEWDKKVFLCTLEKIWLSFWISSITI